MQEVWKDVVGFENYFRVSDLGNVYSKRTNKILKQTTNKEGYKTVNTKVGGRSGTSYSLRVHRMVAEAFLVPPSDDLVERCSQQGYGKVLVRHKDNNKVNNVPCNLEWGTYQDNFNDYKESGVYRYKDKVIVCGTASQYFKGCRCEPCRLAKSTYAKSKYTKEDRKARYVRTGN